jgi:hypothetical protein
MLASIKTPSFGHPLGAFFVGLASFLPPPPPLPRLQVEWWASKGQAWVDEFERCNPLMKDEDLVLDPETLQDIDEAFDE